MKELLFPIGVNLVLGVVLLALLLWKRRPDTVCFADEAAALHEFHHHFPDATGTATLCSDGRAALIETATGLGLLVRDGRRWNARMLAAHELTAVRLRDPRTLELRFADFGWPRARLRFADQDLLSRWRTRLETLERSPGNSHTDLRHA
ncbi:MAG TPA: hypothetical protein VKT22_00010 [Steroidobacteraceae bacterium]|nr:hypothetical protein [Steroidobacteraceae bacterium]